MMKLSQNVTTKKYKIMNTKELRDEDLNYVVIQSNGEPLRFTDGDLVIYGGLEDVNCDILPDDKILTLGEYAKSIGVNWKELVK